MEPAVGEARQARRAEATANSSSATPTATSELSSMATQCSAGQRNEGRRELNGRQRRPRGLRCCAARETLRTRWWRLQVVRASGALTEVPEWTEVRSTAAVTGSHGTTVHSKPWTALLPDAK